MTENTQHRKNCLLMYKRECMNKFLFKIKFRLSISNIAGFSQKRPRVYVYMGKIFLVSQHPVV